MKLTKKLLSLAMALCMVLSLGVVAFAEDGATGDGVESGTTEGGEGTGTTNPTTSTNEDTETVTITKIYEAANDGTTSPAETFSFTIVNTSVTDAADEVTKDNMPTPTIGSVTYAAGEAGSGTKSKDITIKLPEYNSVGIYTYTIKETAGTTAGVTYRSDDITLVVTVIEQNGKIRVAAVHTETPIDNNNATGKKSDQITNTYSAGTLAVSKTVTGNLGDQSKEFKVTVTFTAPTGKTVNEAISYVEDGETKTIATGAWSNNVATAEINLKHNETITFTNIPYEVTYTVVEDDYTSAEEGGYDAATYTDTDDTANDGNGTLNTASETVVITNNKTSEIDTGISLDNIPYVLMLSVVAVGGAALSLKKRTSEK